MISMSGSSGGGSTDAWLRRLLKGDLYSGIEPICQKGVTNLIAATPADSGLTADSWSFEIIKTSGSITIWFTNSNIQGGFNVAVGLQYGHGTGTGGWVEGYDYVNPALRPIFDEIAESIWKEVQRA